MTQSKSRFNLPTVFVIFGITGDLMQSKILLGLFNLYKKGLLPKRFEVIGFSRRDFSDMQLREFLKNVMAQRRYKAREKWDSFLSHFFYNPGDFNSADAYKTLALRLGHVDGMWRVCSNKLFYLAVPPGYYRTILQRLHNSGLTIPCGPEEGWTRIILEKPFGSDLKTAQELDELLGKLFKEEQIYRVDHFLAKETVRNILSFRFSNIFLAPAWNNKYIEKIEIRLLERERVTHRGDFYDGLGALKDVGQNHMLQLLALFTMTRPVDFTAEHIWKRRAEILRALRIYKEEEVGLYTIRGQYEGYTDEPKVDTMSQTETYFKIATFIQSQRWRGVPIYLEAGKAASTVKREEVLVTFKHQNPCLCPPGKHYQNILHYQILPQEKISTRFLVKKPGHDTVLQSQEFKFDYKEAYKHEEFVDAYEKLLLDMIKGDQTLFVTTDEVIQQWKFVEPILAAWDKNKPKLSFYKPAKLPEFAVEKPQQYSKKEIGIIGLGKMGSNFALQLLSKNWQVVGYNRTPQKTKQLTERGLIATNTLEKFVKSLKKPRLIMLALPHGEVIDSVLFDKDGLASLLSRGDIIVDAGNSHYLDSRKRAEKLSKKHIKFVDVGVSGGPSGARLGACLMVGGRRDTFEYLFPFFVEIAVPSGVEFFSGAGAGHFVKMIHNGIEYGIMQAIAEGFTMLKNAHFSLDLTDVAKIYNHGSVIESKLVGFLKEALLVYGQELDPITGSVATSIDAGWILKEAEKTKATVIKQALEYRIKTQKNPTFTGKLISSIRGEVGGHDVLDEKYKLTIMQNETKKL